MLTHEQLIERKNGIGGSDAAAIAGLSKWKTPLDIYLEKTGVIEEYKSENKYTHFGNLLEPVILNEYIRINKYETITIGGTLTRKISNKYPWMRANIDGYLEKENIVIECKTASIHTLHLWGEAGSDQIPDEYLLQCAHYAIVYDAARVDIAVLIAGNDFRIYEYNRNKELEDKLIDIERKFWNENVLAGIPPDPINIKDNLSLWPYSTKKDYLADDDLLNKYYELRAIKQEISLLEVKENSLKTEIQSEMKEADTLIDENGNKLATWKMHSTSRLDISSFEKQHPDIYTRFLKESSTRFFKLNKVEIKK